MKDLVLDRNYKKGDKGKKVKLIQEWLCLHGLNIVIDGDFGPATEGAVRQFQIRESLEEDGIVGESTFGGLIQPMKDVLEPIPVNNESLGEMVVAYAQQHLAVHPREIGGQNMGPWVRLYMNENEGQSWLWCAGFVCFILDQARRSVGASMPFETTFSCDILATSAQEKGIFLKEDDIDDKSQITPGSFFLKRRTVNDWDHVGIVLSTEDDLFHTIEGNTNDEGSREGYEVCQRIRGYKDKDFVLI